MPRQKAERCERGHPLTEANRAPGGRCRACNRMYQRQHRQRKREAKEKESLAAAAVEAAGVERLPVEVNGLALDTAQLTRMIEGHIVEIFRQLTPKKYAQATAAQLHSALDKLIEKRQLVKGEATVIYGQERREKIEELMPLMLEEARRRGLDIDLPRTEYAEV